MPTSLVLTVIGKDRPGLVESLSQTVADHEGNWLESRMSHLAGQFAGILRASVPDAKAEALAEALEALSAEGLRVVVERSHDDDTSELPLLSLELVGADRPGIIREVSQALARAGINVEELATECTSAPMSGETLFHATAKLRVPTGSDVEALREELERLANDLMVDLTLAAE